MNCSELHGVVGVGPSVVWLTVLMLLWFVTLLLVAFLGGSARRRPLMFLFLFASGAATLTGYSVRRALDVTTGVPDGSILAGHVLAILAMVAALESAALLTGVTSATRRALRVGQSLLALDGILLVALFLAIPRSLDHPDFGCWQARSLVVLTYQLLYQGALATSLVVEIVLFRPRIRSVGAPLLRNALRMLIGGFVVGSAYVGVRVWYLFTHAFGLPYPLDGRFGFVPVVLLEAGLGMLGLAACIIGAHRLGRFIGRLSQYHRLRPLWELLSQIAPGHVLGVTRSRWADLVGVPGAQRRLYRRAIEIRDAQWELAGFVSPAMTECATTALRNVQRPPDEDLDLTLEALRLEIACRAKSAGLPHAGPPDSGSWSGGADLDSEARALLLIQRLRKDPWVQATAGAIVEGEGDVAASPTPERA
ncbi:MAB_1171c family putative transporter [Streptacidiphilus anmyonensis]|uniref:MAB_1171c family putative transporter n=1 Tax=Streptacidiphilus anmyonensis TaxID=405782 RepID=UPI0034E27223